MLITDRAMAIKVTGGLSEPSKMPGFGYSLPASSCKTGSKLRNVEGSVCSRCYAWKGCYVFPSTKAAMKRRLKAIRCSQWVDGMVYLLLSQKTSNYFRWHDSGDLQGMGHFKKILEVCKRTPNIIHWLPTHEHKLMRQVEKQGIEIPKNLVIRLSSCMIDAPVRLTSLGGFCASSTFTGVMSEKRKQVERPCNAALRKNTCGNCRICWDKKVKAVSYKMH